MTDHTADVFGSDCIEVMENTNPVIADLDCGEGENPDLGKDICAVRDKDVNGLGEDTEKPSSLTLTLGDELTAEINSTQGEKLEVGNVMPGDDGDGAYYILVSDDGDPSKLDKLYFSGEVDAGGSFTANGIDGSFGSETYVHIFSAQGGTLLQTINFHTSCSAPLVIGDQYGSVSLSGAAVEGKDSGTIYQIGQTETDGDAGVIYQITGGNDADDFDVDPDTGVVTFKETPDFENPTDSDGDNKYDVEVTAFFVDADGNKTGEVCEVKPLEVCVEDDCINILENTNPVIADLDCGEGENPDLGKDICAVRDKDVNGLGEDTEKPSSLTLTLGDELTAEINSTQGDKLEVGNVMPGDDGDGAYYILVSDDGDPSKLDKLYFSGEVDAGGSFTANGIDGSFGSETYVHIFSAQGGTLLQTINFHTSCSAPLVIGDQYGSVSLSGAAVEGKDSGTIYQIGQTETDGDAGVIYQITGGNDADDFDVDPDTGVVTFKETPDFENPTDSDGDNKYDVEVTAFFVDADGNKTGEVCEVKPLEVCVEDDCINILENTNPVIADLDCGEGENPDLGKDICAVRDKDVNGLGEDTEKPSSLTLTLGDELTAEINSTQGDKLEVGNVMPGDDGDGAYYILVSDDGDPSKLDKLYFSGEVDAGGSFTANGIDGSFGSETYVHIFSAQGGTLLQTINFHTSCSAPLVIGDQYGSVSLSGAAVEGKDSGTIYQIGQTETDGDAGVIYQITGGNDADDFDVDPDTGVVTFKETPDFENPTDSDGDNKYDVEVTAFFVDADGNKTGEVCEVKPLEVCVEDQDCIKILENTNPGVIADLDCEEDDDNPDLGKEICAERDALKDQGIEVDKPNQLTLTLNDDLTSVINSGQQGSKLEVSTFNLVNPDGGGLYVRVSNSDKPGDTGTVYFQGDVNFGQSFTALASAADEDKFGSETFIHIFSANGGQLLQTINYHTSCSAPITIGDQIGLVSLDGVGLLNKGTGGTIEFGGSEPLDIVYAITGGDGFDLATGTSPFFNVDPDTGEVTLAFEPDFENPLDDNMDNNYFVEVTGFVLNPDGTRGEICDVKPIEICIEDVDDLGSLSGRYFCDTNDNDVDDGQATDPGIGGVLVTLLDADGNVVGTTTTSNAAGEEGSYSFDGLAPGTYSVRFDNQNGVLDGKQLVTPNQGGNEAIDSDAIGNTTTSTIADIVVKPGEDTPDNDAGAEKLPGSLSGRYFCDTNDNDVDDGQATDPGIGGVLVTLLDADGNVVGTTTTSNAAGEEGSYSFDGLAPGTYSVRFDNQNGVLDGKQLVTPNQGGNEAIDSDAIGNTTTSTIADIVVKPGEDTPDNDAGAEYLPGSLSGRYFCDTNDNDIDDGQATDPGIGGVLVTLLDADGNVVGTTTTSNAAGEEGSYSFDGLAPGTYSVRFDNQNGVLDGKQLVTPNQGGNEAIDSDAIGNTTTSTIADIVVKPGEDTPDNDAGAEYLPGSLSGRYFCDTNDNDIDDGQATDPGVEGVRVGLLSGGVEIAFTFTGTNGAYSFTGLDQGAYSVVFTDPDNVLEGKALVTPNVGGNDAIDSDAIGNTTTSTIADIVVKPGEDTPDNDAGAEKLPGSLSGRYFCDTNDNDVDDGQATDPGIGGVLVTLLDADGNVVGTTTTSNAAGEEGSYSFDGLAPGTYSVRFDNQNGVLDGKQLVTPNQGGNEAIDSDAIGNTTTSTIADIVVKPGEDTPDNDAGAEYLPGSLSGRYFCDTNDNDIDDGQATDPGVEGVRVGLLSGGVEIAFTFTGTNGAYSFTGLDQGAYSVVFTDPDNVLEGKALVTPNVGGNDAIDSDAIGDTGESEITGIIVKPGENTPDNDAGVFPNDAPEPADDAAAVCATETVAIDALANDSDPNGDAFSIAHINGVAVTAGDMVTLSTGALVTLNANGTLSYDSSGGTYGGISAADLVIGEQAFDSFTYSVSDTFGATGTATVDIGICGALNTAETIAQSGNIPTTVSFRIDILAETPLAEAYTLTTSDPDPASASMFDGAVFTEAYCLDRDDAIVRGVDVDANVYVGTAALAAGSSLGAEALGNLDLITWILNQDFGSKDNGDGTNTTYTETEIQAAIWDLVGDAPFVPGGTGTLANAAEIVGFAVDDIDCDGMADGGAEGFAAGAGDILALVLDPSTPYNTAHRQPFVIGVDFDDVDEECVCNLDDFVFV